jgi:hypothetical protein
MPHGLAIGIASCGRRPHLEWSLTLPSLVTNGPVGMNIGWIVAQNEDKKSFIGKTRAENRIKIAKRAIQVGFEYLFFLDDDTLCPNFTLKALHYQLANDPQAMICGGIYCTKEVTPCPIVFKELGGGPFYNWKIGDVFPCAGIGAGAMLIKTEVFSKINEPWFDEPHDTPIDKIEVINGVETPIGHSGGTDDLYFCKKVSDAGYKILAHGGVLPIHMDDDGKMYTLPLNSYPCQGFNLEVMPQQ